MTVSNLILNVIAYILYQWESLGNKESISLFTYLCPVNRCLGRDHPPKNLIQHLRGRVQLKTKASRCTSFWITLPCAGPAGGSAPPAAEMLPLPHQVGFWPLWAGNLWVTQGRCVLSSSSPRTADSEQELTSNGSLGGTVCHWKPFAMRKLKHREQ